ncbi:MAG: DUF350 domain-containing protein [Myxococcales bacterium]|nr:DUF350 domain-containing protein [Myxococcales bacterium]
MNDILGYGFLAAIKGVALGQVLSSAIYSVIGIAMFLLAYWLLDKVTPFSVHREISEDQNTALGIIIGSIMIAIAIIIHGAIAG